MRRFKAHQLITSQLDVCCHFLPQCKKQNKKTTTKNPHILSMQTCVCGACVGMAAVFSAWPCGELVQFVLCFRPLTVEIGFSRLPQLKEEVGVDGWTDEWMTLKVIHSSPSSSYLRVYLKLLNLAMKKLN